MKPLDAVSARLFPSLAAYARNVRRRELLALIGTALSAYVLARDALGAYQGRVATEGLHAMLQRVNEIEERCQGSRKLITSKAAAQVIVQQIEDKRREP